MKLTVKAAAGQAADDATRLAQQMATALTGAMRDVGKLAVAKGKQSIASSGLGARWVRSLRAINRPKSGTSLNPSVFIHSTINYSDIFEHGGVINGKPFLWLPLPNVPKAGGRPLTPRQYVRQFGKLRTIKRDGKPPMLGGEVRVNVRPGKRVSRRALKGTISRRNTSVVVPLYVAVPSVTLTKKFDVQGAAEDAFEKFNDFYQQQLDKLTAANGS